MRNRSIEPRSSARSRESYEAVHGSFPELVRRHLKSEDGI